MSDTRGLIIDTSCPVNWAHPVNWGRVLWLLATTHPGWWRGRTARDLVGLSGRKANNGTLVNDAAWRPGPYGLAAVTFDGTGDHITLPNCVSYANTDSHTYMAWVNTAGTGTHQWIITTGIDSDGTVLALNSSRQIAFWYDGANAVFSGSAMLDTDRWYHVAATWNAADTKVRTYVNGVPDATSSAIATTWAAHTGGTGFVGTYHNGSTFPYAGRISDIGQWSRAISDAEVWTAYDQSRRRYPDALRYVRSWLFGAPVVVGGGETLTPSVGTIRFSGTNPGVLLGSILLAPSVGAVRFAGVNPTVGLGSLLLTPTSGVIRFSGVNPFVGTGTMLVSPTPGAIRFAGVNPGVTLGSLVIVPTPVAIRFAAQNPSLILSSVIVTPLTGGIRFAGVNPSVLTGIFVEPNRLEFVLGIMRRIEFELGITRRREYQ